MFLTHLKLLWILSTTIMQAYQFKYISHSLSIFNPEPSLFSAPTLHVIEWSSCKEFFFVHLFFKSDNISPTTFRGHASVNYIVKNCSTYREILPLLPELFVYSHMTNGSLLSGKTELRERHRRNLVSQETNGPRVLKIW